MNIAIFKTGQQPKYLTSVNGAEYMADPTAKEGQVTPIDSDTLINPDITAVKNIPVKYWKKSGNSIIEMTQAEKDAVEASELAQRKLSADNFQTNQLAIFTALIKVINLRLSAGQKITKAELITAIKKEIN